MTRPFDRLLHLGNVVVDIVLQVDALPERGADMLATAGETTAGGGFNVIAAAARQGLPVGYGGLHGTGPFGDIARAALAVEGAALLQPIATGGDTGFVVCLVDAGGERTFVTRPGVETTLGATDLARIRVDERDAIQLSGYSLAHPAVLAALLDWLPGVPIAVPVFFDPGPLIDLVAPAALDAVLTRVDWFTCNGTEATVLTGESDLMAAAEALARRTGRSGVIVRTGATGCLVSTRQSRPTRIPGFRVTSVDSNGAGDAHTGVFIASLARGTAPEAAARIANAAAAQAVSRHGPAMSPTSDELRQFLTSAGVHC